MGHVIVETLIENNYKVIAIARNLSKLEALEKISPRNIEYYPADLSSLVEIKEVFDRITSKITSIDLLVNCAGGGPLGGIQDTHDSFWESSIQLKVLGYIRTCKESLPLLKMSTNGRIINIVGILGKYPSPFMIVSSTVNAALLAFTKALSLELSDSNITVNAINPGAVKSQLWEKIAEQASISENEELQFLTNPEIKLALPEDIARAVLYLSDKSSQSINGISLDIDNGAAQ